MRESTREIDLNPPGSSGKSETARDADTDRLSEVLRSNRRCLERIDRELSGMEKSKQKPSRRPGTGDQTLRRIKRLHREKKATLEAIETLESRDLPPLETPSSSPCTESVGDYGVVGSAEPSHRSQPDILEDRSPFKETAPEALDATDLPDSSPHPRMN